MCCRPTGELPPLRVHVWHPREAPSQRDTSPGALQVAGSGITGAPNHDFSKPWDEVRLVLYSMLVEAPRYIISQ